MAITKILPVRGQLKGCLDYAANPQKTEYLNTADIQRLMNYTQSGDKTEHQLYVSGFNCDPQNAYYLMQATKRRWGKPLDSGNVGYHIIQSFKPGEATPDQVHEIGCEFARRFLEDRFECTVSTHLDKGHLHNHIVVNSVSFMDGRMFRNDFTTYYKGIRAVSDELCRENRLSVVETDGHGKSYGEWKHEKEGSPTLRGMVKTDVEMAIAAADSFAGFIAELQKMGYAVKYGPKAAHMTVRHKEAQKNIRLDKISPHFSEDSLRRYFRELHITCCVMISCGTIAIGGNATFCWKVKSQRLMNCWLTKKICKPNTTALRRNAGCSIAERVKLPLPIIQGKYRHSQPVPENCGGKLSLVLTLRWIARWRRIRSKGRHYYGMTSAKKIYIS
mgnify:CR=1 FL=1